MKHFFIDTNIVLDFLLDRTPHAVNAEKLFNLSYLGEIKLYISACSYDTIFYILTLNKSKVEAFKLLNELFSITETINTSKSIIAQSLQSGFNDFEDAIQNFSACSIPQIETIITRNSKDFKLSVLNVLNPKETLHLLKK